MWHNYTCCKLLNKVSARFHSNNFLRLTYSLFYFIRVSGYPLPHNSIPHRFSVRSRACTNDSICSMSHWIVDSSATRTNWIIWIHPIHLKVRFQRRICLKIRHHCSVCDKNAHIFLHMYFIYFYWLIYRISSFLYVLYYLSMPLFCTLPAFLYIHYSTVILCFFSHSRAWTLTLHY